MDALDDIIRKIQTESELTVELRNQLHGCLSTHPWGKGKNFAQRKNEALFATAQGRYVPASLRYELERACDPR